MAHIDTINSRWMNFDLPYRIGSPHGLIRFAKIGQMGKPWQRPLLQYIRLPQERKPLAPKKPSKISTVNYLSFCFFLFFDKK